MSASAFAEASGSASSTAKMSRGPSLLRAPCCSERRGSKAKARATQEGESIAAASGVAVGQTSRCHRRRLRLKETLQGGDRDGDSAQGRGTETRKQMQGETQNYRPGERHTETRWKQSRGSERQTHPKALGAPAASAKKSGKAPLLCQPRKKPTYSTDKHTYTSGAY